MKDKVASAIEKLSHMKRISDVEVVDAVTLAVQFNWVDRCFKLSKSQYRMLEMFKDISRYKNGKTIGVECGWGGHKTIKWLLDKQIIQEVMLEDGFTNLAFNFDLEVN